MLRTAAVAVFGTLALAAACAGERTTPTADGGQRADAAGPSTDGAIPAARMFAHTDEMLYTVDPGSFDLVEVGPFQLDAADAMNDLAVTPDGEIYGLTGRKLFTIDRTNGRAEYVGPVTGEQNVAMTFMPDGTLLAADAEGGVRAVDPASGAVTELGEYGDGYATAGDLVAVSDGTMYAIADGGPGGGEQDDNVLLRIDPASGQALDRIGNIGFDGVWGSAYAGGNVYAFTRDGEIIEIDRATGVGTLVRVHDGVRFYGAAVTPLVEVD